MRLSPLDVLQSAQHAIHQLGSQDLAEKDALSCAAVLGHQHPALRLCFPWLILGT